MRLRSLVGIVVPAVLVLSCASPRGGRSSAQVVHGSPRAMGPLAARKAAVNALNRVKGVGVESDIADVEIAPDHFAFAFRYRNQTSAPATCAYDFGSPGGLSFKSGRVRRYVVRIKGCHLDWASGAGGQASATAFVDAVATLEAYFLEDHSLQTDTQLKTFEQVAAPYRAQKKHPPMGEDVRRYQVQAEAAFDEKRYEDAIVLYDNGLQLSPDWPEGHYNIALLYGKLGILPEAVKHLRMYVALVPNAPDARKARDKQYVWEGKLASAKSSAATTAAAAPPEPQARGSEAGGSLAPGQDAEEPSVSGGAASRAFMRDLLDAGADSGGGDMAPQEPADADAGGGMLAPSK